MKTLKSNYIIKNVDIGWYIKCYSGKQWVKFLITEDMCRHVVGEFVLTKKLGSLIHKKKKKKKKVKK